MFCRNDDGILTHSIITFLGKLVVRIAVQQCKRHAILETAHSGLVGGHFSLMCTLWSISVTLVAQVEEVSEGIL